MTGAAKTGIAGAHHAASAHRTAAAIAWVFVAIGLALFCIARAPIERVEIGVAIFAPEKGLTAGLHNGSAVTGTPHDPVFVCRPFTDKGIDDVCTGGSSPFALNVLTAAPKGRVGPVLLIPLSF